MDGHSWFLQYCLGKVTSELMITCRSMPYFYKLSSAESSFQWVVPEVFLSNKWRVRLACGFER